MPAKKRTNVMYHPDDLRYDKPFKHLKRHDAYLVTLQTETNQFPGLSDVVPGYGDRALPKGVILHFHSLPNYRVFIYKPGHVGDLDRAVEIGETPSLDEAIAAILSH